MIIFSVVIPCYNHGKYIRQALESVWEYPYQDEVEIIVVNDGSNDLQTLEILSGLNANNLVVINQENQGLSCARNNGIKKCQGEFVLLLDSDNYISTTFLSEAKQVFEKHPSVSIIYTDKYVFTTGGSKLKKVNVGTFDPALLVYGNYIDACAIVRKEVFNKIGGYDEKMKSGYEDWEFWIRAASHNLKFHYIKKYLFYYRDEYNSMSKDSNKKRHEIMKYVLLKHIDYVITLLIDGRVKQSYIHRKPFRFGFKHLFNF